MIVITRNCPSALYCAEGEQVAQGGGRDRAEGVVGESGVEVVLCATMPHGTLRPYP